jgi:ABC-type ATPase involved in cell division
VAIVSLYELTGAMGHGAEFGRQLAPPSSIEAYLFIAAIYFVFCYSMSRYSQWIEKRLVTQQAPLQDNTMSEPIITFDKVNKWYGNNFHVLRDIDLSVAKGERIVICGPSGSGKSTLIRCINRLEEHQQGTLTGGRGGTHRRHEGHRGHVRKNVGMVFQQFNLFPHLTVLENLTLSPMWVGKLPKKEAEEKAMEQLRRVRIAEQASKYPLQLSGGQQQRVAIARAPVPHAQDHAVRRAHQRAGPPR